MMITTWREFLKILMIGGAFAWFCVMLVLAVEAIRNRRIK